MAVMPFTGKQNFHINQKTSEGARNLCNIRASTAARKYRLHYPFLAKKYSRNILSKFGFASTVRNERESPSHFMGEGLGRGQRRFDQIMSSYKKTKQTVIGKYNASTNIRLRRCNYPWLKTL